MIRSPGTSSAAAIVRSRPPRTTEADGSTARLNAISARSAPDSWKKPRTALSATIAAMTPASNPSPITAETVAAARSRAVSGFVNCLTAIRA
jgi:hypothetical protein